jgi:hypothetical protein
MLHPAVVDDQLAALDDGFRGLLELSDRSGAKSSYKKHNRAIRKLIPKVSSQIELAQGTARPSASATQEDERIIETLDGLVPAAALSYRQAIIDLADDKRLSFRGPALELREALRETLDHLAPDDAVTSVQGYAHEKGRLKPTMKQKVRFILKARGQSKSSSEVPEQTTITVEEMVGTLTRSVYDRSSGAAHTASERKTVVQIRRYVVAVLHHILEI